MRFRAPDDEVFEGEDYQDIVMMMASQKMHEPRSLASYRRATANRVRSMYGHHVDDSSDQEFIETLVDCGLLTAE